MYKEFYNLSAEPFRVTPDPGFLFLTDQHKEALAAIIYGIAKRKGFVCITGEVGVGKTTILRSYLEGVDEPGLKFVYVYNPNVSFQALLRHIFKEIALDHAGDDLPGMVEALQQWLVEAHARRETLVLLIDEAQNMPIGTLENLRMLSNLETATEKLVQIVLVGQPELEALLAERQLRQVESRIAVRTRLGPLTLADSEAYVRHRLRCVALDTQPAISDAAIRLIARAAKGIPRRINVICDNALMTGFGHKARPVDEKIAREVLKDLGARDSRQGWRAIIGRLDLPPVPPRLVMGAGALATAAVVLWAGLMLRGPAAAPEVAAPISPLASPPAVASGPPVALMPKVVEPQPAPPPPEIAAIKEVADPPPMTVPLPAIAAAARAPLRIVAPGDTLTGLASQVYGKVDKQALEWVKTHNPAITDIDRLQVGQIIEFPPLPN